MTTPARPTGPTDPEAIARRRRAARLTIADANADLEDRISATLEIFSVEHELSMARAHALGYGDRHPDLPTYVAGILSSSWKTRTFDPDVLDALKDLYPPQRLQGLVINSWEWSPADPANPDQDRRMVAPDSPGTRTRR